MAAANADRDLLFGLLALQNGLIARDQLVTAFALWTSSAKRPMADILVDQGALTEPQRALLDALVEAHLKLHGGDPEKSLAALSLDLNPTTRESLAAAGGTEVEASLAHVGVGPNGNEIRDCSLTYSVGDATSAGQRFRVLRPHARGNLGAVFVALDGELKREVALKQILDHHADDPASRQRFVVEAEITGGLEHPGIVPVYGLGSYGDGRPYYAMRFIKGDSLKEAIAQFHADAVSKKDAGQRSLELRKLLRRFTDVCNAIDYAHSRGILHRDIKPGNVIVGRYGETLVVDWGLAKAVGRDEPGIHADEATLRPSSASGSAETLPGSAMGTPAYMSPEQARGDLLALGPRSDVYSLGATLHHLLTGKPPFAGNDIGEVLRKVRQGAFVPPRRLDPSIDRALEAVCLKAMELKPEDRYASCLALAEDVERWLADEPVVAYPEPWTRTLIRWLTRHRTGVTAAAAALLVGLVGLGSVAAVQTKARNILDRKNSELTAANTALDLQRRRAEINEAEAIAAVKRFRDAVTENPELKNNPALEGLRKTLLKEPLTFFRGLRERLQADRDTRPAALAQLTRVIYDYAQLADEIGDPQDGLKAYEDLLAIWLGLTRDDPGNSQFQSGLATSHNNIGILLHDTGKPAEALAAYEQARAIFQRLARDNPPVTDFQSGLAASHNNIGNLLHATGKPAEALAAHEQARAIRQRLARDNPTVTDFQSGLATSHNSIGILLRATGKPAEALAAHEQARAIRQRLAWDNPTVTDFQSDLAASHLNIGALLHTTGKPAEALAACEQARAIQERLARDNPTVTKFQRDLATSHDGIGILLRATGKPAEALAAYEQALPIRQRLARDNPTVTGFQSDLATSHHNIGALLHDTSKPAEALAAYERARAIQERLARDNPAVTDFQSDLATSHLNIGALLHATSKPAEALAAYERARAIQERLARDHPESPRYDSSVGITLNNLAMLDLKAKRFTEARDKLREAIIWQKKALDAYPAHPEYRQALGSHYGNLILAARGLGNDHEAAEAQRGLDELQASDPRIQALDVRLAAVRKGQAPRDNAERLALAQRAYDTKHHATAARLWSEAIASDPRLAEDRQAQHPYNAACAAALTAAGQDQDEPALDDAGKARLRQQALGWLKGELAAWAPSIAKGPAQARAAVAQTLRHWREDSDLAGVRDPAALAKLPEPEQKDWQALWDEVDSRLRRLEANPKAEAKPGPPADELPADPFAGARF